MNGIYPTTPVTQRYSPQTTPRPGFDGTAFFTGVNDADTNGQLVGQEIISDDYVQQLLATKDAFYLMSTNWITGQERNDQKKISAFEEYFFSEDRIWGTQEAQIDPYDFGTKQRELLDQMNASSELREICFSLAAAGMSDCQDHAAAMFLAMQKEALEISMKSPENVSEAKLIHYGLALQNQHNLEKLIQEDSVIRRAVNSSEGTEAKLLLYLICDGLGIELPVPFNSMIHGEVAIWVFKEACRNELDLAIEPSDIDVQRYIIDIVSKAISPRNKPKASFLAEQPVWQAFIDRVNLDLYITQKKDIEQRKNEKLDLAYQEMDLLTGTSCNANEVTMRNIDFAHQLLVIEETAKKEIAQLYFDETKRLLKNYRPPGSPHEI